MSIFGYSESDSDGYDSREPNEIEKEFSSCCDAPVINGICQQCGQDLKAYSENFSLCHFVQMVNSVCPKCGMTKQDYYREQRAKEYNAYFDFNKLPEINKIEVLIK